MTTAEIIAAIEAKENELSELRANLRAAEKAVGDCAAEIALLKDHGLNGGR
jgi:hypothetical protein